MTATPPIVDRETWQEQIDALRVREKVHTREGDAIAAPASVSEYAARCPRVASSRVSRPAATSRLSRLLRMLDATPPRALEQLAEVAPVAEDHVAQHEHRRRSPSTSMAALIA
jgi:hypothetical protein